MDKLATLHRVSKVYGLPDFVKEAEFYEEPTTKLPSSSFAAPWSRTYPCHTKAATYISNITFWERAVNDSREEDTLVGRRLLEFARDWDIEPDVKSALTKIAEDKRNAIPKLTAEDFALVVDDGNMQYRYPMTNAEVLKESADNFVKQAHLYPYAWRQDIAAKLMSKAAQLGVDSLEATLGTLAAKSSRPSSEVADAIEKRAYSVKQADVTQALLKVAGFVRRNKSSHALMAKTAEMLDGVDRKAGLYKFYKQASDDSYTNKDKHYLPLPEDVCFQRVKVADAAIKLQTGDAVSLQGLESAGLQPFQVLPDYIDSVTTQGKLDLDKCAEILPTMPADDARLLVSAINATVKQANFGMGGGGGDVTQPIKPLVPQQRQMAQKGVPWDKIGVRQINLGATKQADLTGDGVGRPPGGNFGKLSVTPYNKNVNSFPAPKPSQIAATQQPARQMPTAPNPLGTC